MDLPPRKKQKLREATEDSIDRFSVSGMKVEAKVVHVHDGDTCDLVFYIGDEMNRFQCRLAGLDATELGKRDGKGRKGEIARDFLAWLCMGEKPNRFPDEDKAWTKGQLQKKLDKSNNLVYATLDDFEKYGRLLVTIKGSKHVRKSFNKLLVEYGYAIYKEYKN